MSMGQSGVPLKKLIAFVGANNRLESAQRERKRAEQAYKDAEREFNTAWNAMTPTQQRAINTAFEVDPDA